MLKHMLVGFGTLAVSAGLALPILAQGTKAPVDESKLEKEIYNEENLNKPFAEIEGRVNDAITRVGLTEVAAIDWSKVATRFGSERMESTKPEGTEMGKGAGAVPLSKIRTFYVEDEACIKRIGESPKHALWVPNFAIYERDGKTFFVYKKYSALMAKHAEPGVTEKHLEHARDLERKLNQLCENLKGGKT